MTETLLDELRRLQLDTDHYAVFGSAPLYMKRFKAVLGDLDVIARGEAWDQALELVRRGVLAGPDRPPSGRGQRIRHPEIRIEIFDEWTSSVFDVNHLIDTAEVIDGMRFVQLEEVLYWKAMSDRPKDRRDIQVFKANENRTVRSRILPLW
jgi:hypothetical protein